MTLKTHVILVLISLFFFWIILRGMKKSKLSSEIAVVWIPFLLMLILISIFPQISEAVASLMGIKTVINAVFLVVIFLLICWVYVLCVQVSMLNEKVKNLVQEISLAKTDEESSGKDKV